MSAKVERTKSLIRQTVPKCPTGILGLDEITLGGLPRGRPTLVVGGAGCGKTLLGMQFLVRGAADLGEPGVCMTFEETADELMSNVSSLGLDVAGLITQNKLSINHVNIERSLIDETGEYDLEGLFIRLSHAVESIGAKRVLLDSPEAMFAGVNDQSILRFELRRMFRWLKDKKLTAVVTGERGGSTLTRYGLEEYLSDCVILLEHCGSETVLTRRLRVVKYRGSTHGTNEYPFVIDNDGIAVLPITSLDLKHAAATTQVSTGIRGLDEMFGGGGFYRGSSILVTGTAGTGKSSLTAQFIDAACARGERCAYFSFEESPVQIIRNMRSIGIDLERWVDRGLLQFQSYRPTTLGLETHLVKIHQVISEMNPSSVAVDPVTALLHSGGVAQARNMLLRLIDFLKERQITALLTILSTNENLLERSEVSISSIVDVWLLLRDIESAGERNRELYILKARGLPHSNQIREFLLTNRGAELRDVYLGEAGLLTGSARVTQEAKDQSMALSASQLIERQKLLLERRRRTIEAQIAALRLDLETEEQESQQLINHEEVKIRKWEHDRMVMAKSRAAGKGLWQFEALHAQLEGAQK